MHVSVLSVAQLITLVIAIVLFNAAVCPRTRVSLKTKVHICSSPHRQNTSCPEGINRSVVRRLWEVGGSQVLANISPGNMLGMRTLTCRV